MGSGFLVFFLRLAISQPASPAEAIRHRTMCRAPPILFIHPSIARYIQKQYITSLSSVAMCVLISWPQGRDPQGYPRPLISCALLPGPKFVYYSAVESAIKPQQIGFCRWPDIYIVMLCLDTPATQLETDKERRATYEVSGLNAYATANAARLP